MPEALGEDVTENPHRNVEDRREDRRIGGEERAAVEQLVNEELTKLV